MPDALTQALNAFKFHIEWAGAALGFSDVSGLGANNYILSPAFLTQQQNTLTLSRGLFTGTIEFKPWLNITSTIAHDLTIHLRDEQQQLVASWVANKAILVQHVAAVNSDGKTVAIESLHLQHAGLTPL